MSNARYTNYEEMQKIKKLIQDLELRRLQEKETTPTKKGSWRTTWEKKNLKDKVDKMKGSWRSLNRCVFRLLLIAKINV